MLSLPVIGGWLVTSGLGEQAERWMPALISSTVSSHSVIPSWTVFHQHHEHNDKQPNIRQHLISLLLLRGENSISNGQTHPLALASLPEPTHPPDTEPPTLTPTCPPTVSSISQPGSSSPSSP